MGDQTQNKPGAEQIDTSKLARLRSRFDRVKSSRVLNGYLYGPFVFKPDVNSGLTIRHRFILYRSLDLREYVEFDWNQVIWIEGHTLATEAQDSGGNATEGSTTGGDPANSSGTNGGTSGGTTGGDPANGSGNSSGKTGAETSHIPPRVTVWLSADETVAVGGFLVGSIADNYLPPDEVSAHLMGQQQQMAALLAAGSIAGCSTNPQCNL